MGWETFCTKPWYADWALVNNATTTVHQSCSLGQSTQQLFQSLKTKVTIYSLFILLSAKVLPSQLAGKQGCCPSWSQGSSALGTAGLLLPAGSSLSARAPPAPEQRLLLPLCCAHLGALGIPSCPSHSRTVTYSKGTADGEWLSVQCGYFTWGLWGTSLQDLCSQDHSYGYSCFILFPETTETCSRAKREQKEQIPSPPCSGDISCTRLQLTWCVPCSFPAHLSAVKQMPSAAEGAGSLQSNIWGRAAQGKVRTCRQFFIISSSVLN